jgi:hypothetical protein
VPTEQQEPATKICFVIAPIGRAGSEHRKHADMLLNLIIRPTLEADSLGYKVVRADEEDDPGMITDKVIRRLINADLAIADLSFLNPNVFYELGIRHYTRKPIIHMAQKDTQLPFDTADQRTLFFDPFDWHEITAARNALHKLVLAVLHPDYQVNTVVTRVQAAEQVAKSDNPLEMLVTSLSDRIDRLEADAKSFQPSRFRKAGTISPFLIGPIQSAVQHLEANGHAEVTSEGYFVNVDKLTDALNNANYFYSVSDERTLRGWVDKTFANSEEIWRSLQVFEIPF